MNLRRGGSGQLFWLPDSGGLDTRSKKVGWVRTGILNPINRSILHSSKLNYNFTFTLFFFFFFFFFFKKITITLIDKKTFEILSLYFKFEKLTILLITL
jgi:hypothetical protein